MWSTISIIISLPIPIFNTGMEVIMQDLLSQRIYVVAWVNVVSRHGLIIAQFCCFCDDSFQQPGCVRPHFLAISDTLNALCHYIIHS